MSGIMDGLFSWRRGRDAGLLCLLAAAAAVGVVEPLQASQGGPVQNRGGTINSEIERVPGSTEQVRDSSSGVMPSLSNRNQGSTDTNMTSNSTGSGPRSTAAPAVDGPKVDPWLIELAEKAIEEVERMLGGQDAHGEMDPESVLVESDGVVDRSGHADMKKGTITVNGKTYQFRSGGFGKGYLPSGEYTVSNARLRSSSAMSQGGFGYSFDLNDAWDSRVGATRTLLRIHPDGNNPGTLGCVGIVGGGDVQRQFYSDLSQELKAHGGSMKIYIP